MDPYDIIFHPYVTEKTMNFMDKNNALEFVVRRTANKKTIKKAIEEMFEVKVKDVRTRITKNGKHAIVTFMPEFKAEDIGMRIGIF
ncbi:MAG: 50S ribosomal protein L23 [Candidatus Thermoplasmatota archaeon]|jgi:large subunit ribosomal protein L23|nr:50S ribosomal protein L23 [Candidatus Thermoplasmatota archaeon]